MGASRRFISRYRKIDKEIERGNLDNAKDQISAMFESSQLTVYEVARLWLLRGELAKAMDDKTMQLSSYRKAIVAAGQWIEDGVYASVLQSIVILELKLGKYSSALRNFENLSKLSTEPGQFSKLSKYIVSVEDQIASDKIIAVPASLRADRQCEDCSADWQYRPMRRKFSITSIKGNLSSLEIRCDWRRVRVSASSSYRIARKFMWRAGNTHNKFDIRRSRSERTLAILGARSLLNSGDRHE